MPVILQIALGSATLLICAMLHIAMISAMISHLRSHHYLRARPSNIRRMALVAALFLVSLTSHTIHVYIHAFSIWAVGALDGYEQPIYFALVTYTTVGYGDVVLSPDFRILGGMISVTGILMFGMTTAFLVGLFNRVLGERDI
jgi:hypothetical protein